jgi:hypothetical protein
MREPANIQAPSAAEGPCCSKTSVRFQFSEQRENLLTAGCGISFCSERAQDKEPQVYPCAIMTSCPMDSWQSSQPALCCFARACSLSHLVNPSRRPRTCHRRNQHIGVNHGPARTTGFDSVGSSERGTLTPPTFETAYVGARNSPWNQPCVSRDLIGSIRSTTS